MVEAANDNNIWMVGAGDFAGQFLDRIVDTDSPALITNYENKVKKLEEENIVLKEKIQNCGRPLESFDKTFQTVSISFPFSLIGELEGDKKDGAEGRTRTVTGLPPLDFESSASTNFTTSA